MAENIADAIEVSDLVLVMKIQRLMDAEQIDAQESERRVFAELAARELPGVGRRLAWAERTRA